MKKFIAKWLSRNAMSQIFNNIPKEIKSSFVITLVVSVISSVITYKIVERKIPKIAVVDLPYLNNDFIVNLSRHLIEQKASDEELTQAVKIYLKTLESILKDISQSKQNYVLLQKQTVVSEDIEDITKDLEKTLFNAVITQTKGEGGHEK